jgi:hypothetical protein
LAKYDDDPGTYLFYCDREWNCLDDTYHQDLAAAEALRRVAHLRPARRVRDLSGLQPPAVDVNTIIVRCCGATI